MQIRLTQLRSYLPGLVECVAYACKGPGHSNRVPHVTRRRWQVNAMRHVNAARARVRACLKGIAAAEAALLALTH